MKHVVMPYVEAGLFPLLRVQLVTLAQVNIEQREA